MVDWEMSTLGDPLTDIALMCVYRQPSSTPSSFSTPPGPALRYPSADAIAARYAELAGIDLGDWDFTWPIT